MKSQLITRHADVYLCHSFSPASSSLSAINNGAGIFSFNDCTVTDYGKYIKITSKDLNGKVNGYDLVPWNNVACIEKH